jgi:predicted ester cyclase
MYMVAFPDERPTEIRHLADGNTTVTEWATMATHTGALPMPTGDLLPATGKTVKLAGVTIADLEGDKVKRQVFYWDNADFLQQLGLLTAPEVATAG